MVAKPAEQSSLQQYFYTELRRRAYHVPIPGYARFMDMVREFSHHIGALCCVDEQDILSLFRIRVKNQNLIDAANALYALAKVIEASEISDFVGELEWTGEHPSLTDDVFLGNPRLMYNANLLIDEFLEFVKTQELRMEYVQQRRCLPIFQLVLDKHQRTIQANYEQVLEERAMNGVRFDLSASTRDMYVLANIRYSVLMAKLADEGKILEKARLLVPDAAMICNLRGEDDV